MNKKHLKLNALIVFGILWLNFAKAQESTNASGGNGAGNGGTVAYSIGQVFYTSLSGVPGSVADGVQNAYEIFTTGVSETGQDIVLTAFPNPTTGNLNLLISNYKSEKLSYKIFDVQGKMLGNFKITSEKTQINMSNLASATYFFDVVNNDGKKIQSFKIIKN